MSSKSIETCYRTTSDAAVLTRFMKRYITGRRILTPMNLSCLTRFWTNGRRDHPLVKSFTRKIKDTGISGESFRITPENIPKPRKRKLVTLEDVIVIYDEDNAPDIQTMEDGRKRIVIVTAGLVTDDIDTGKIGKAIDCSRRTSDLVITEDQQTTTRKLFISGTMDNDTLQLWGSNGYRCRKISGSPLLMIVEMISTPHKVSPVRSTLSPSSAMNSPEFCASSPWKVGVRFTPDPGLCQYHRIYALFINEAFETQQWKVAPWKKMLPDERKATSQLRQPPSQKHYPLFSTDFLPQIPLHLGS